MIGRLTGLQAIGIDVLALLLVTLRYDRRNGTASLSATTMHQLTNLTMCYVKKNSPHLVFA